LADWAKQTRFVTAETRRVPLIRIEGEIGAYWDLSDGSLAKPDLEVTTS
jgi:hypothetical protein